MMLQCTRSGSLQFLQSYTTPSRPKCEHDNGFINITRSRSPSPATGRYEGHNQGVARCSNRPSPNFSWTSSEFPGIQLGPVEAMNRKAAKTHNNLQALTI